MQANVKNALRELLKHQKGFIHINNWPSCYFNYSSLLLTLNLFKHV